MTVVDSSLDDHPEIAGLTYDGDAECFLIADLADLQTLTDFVNAGHTCTGITFKQTADIDMSSIANFDVIGSKANQFNGIFDGDNHKIGNLTVDTSGTSYRGLFGYVGANGILKNIRLDNASVTGRDYVGCLVGANNGMISDCTLTNSSVDAYYPGYDYVGGMAGANYKTVKGCIVDNINVRSNSGSNPRAGGIIGYNSGTIDNTNLALNVGINTYSSSSGAYKGAVSGTGGTAVTGYYYNYYYNCGYLGGTGGDDNYTERAFKLTIPIPASNTTPRFTLRSTRRLPSAARPPPARGIPTTPRSRGNTLTLTGDAVLTDHNYNSTENCYEIDSVETASKRFNVRCLHQCGQCR